MFLEDDDIIIFTDGFWDDPKRVRHKMALEWARAGNRVLWIERPPYPGDFASRTGLLGRSLAGGLRQVADRLWVGASPPAFPRMARGGAIGRGLRRLHRPLDGLRIRGYLRALAMRPRLLVLFQLAAHHDLLDVVPCQASIYYCNDLVGYGAASAGDLEEERRCCAKVDLVFATSEAIRARLADWNQNVYHIPHAVDPQWWEEGRGRLPEFFRGRERPRLVFTGVCTPRLDLVLLEELARLRPGWDFVMVGPVQKIDDEARRLASGLGNVHFVKGVGVEDIPGYLEGATALMFPYRLTEAEHHVGLPLKFYEYAISGHPILTTPFTAFEGVEQGLLRFGNDAEAWARHLDEIAAGGAGEQERATRITLAQSNSYASRIELQRAALAKALARNSTA